MPKKITVFLGVLAVLAGLAQAAGTDNQKTDFTILSSVELVNESFRYDNRTVVYRGEVIGPVMSRGDHAWINIYDGTYAIGVWCPKDYTKGIRFHGDYNNKGDTVEVSGVFHRACTSHGGDLDIHCESLKVVEEGHRIEHKVRKSDVYIALTLGLVAVILILTEFTISGIKKFLSYLEREYGIEMVYALEDLTKSVVGGKKT